MKRYILLFLLIILPTGLFLASCGGGSGDDSTGTENSNSGNETNINPETDCVYVGAFESVLSFLELSDLSVNTPEDLIAEERVVGVLDGASDVEAIVYDFLDNGSFPDTGRLFVADNDFLLEVDSSNAEAKMVDMFGILSVPGTGPENIDNVDGLAFDPNNNLFYGSERTDGLDFIFSFNLTGGSDAMIENLELLSVMPGDISCGTGFCNDVDDLAFDVTTEMLLAIFNRNDVTNVLVEIDVTDGSATEIGTIFVDNCSTQLEDIEGLGVTLNGRIFASTGFFGNNPNAFFELEIDDSVSPVRVCATRIVGLENMDAESLDCSIDSTL